MAKYVLDENNNKIEVTDEVGNTTVHEIKCCVSGTAFKKAYVSQAKYNELEAGGLLQPNTEYVITDDTTLDEINAQLLEHSNTLAEHTTEFNAMLERIKENEEYIDSKTPHLYEHNIMLTFVNDNSIAKNSVAYFTLYTSSNVQFTKETLHAYLKGKGVRNISGYHIKESKYYSLITLSAHSDTYDEFRTNYVNGDLVTNQGFKVSDKVSGITDNVTQIY